MYCTLSLTHITLTTRCEPESRESGGMQRAADKTAVPIGVGVQSEMVKVGRTLRHGRTVTDRVAESIFNAD